MNDLDKIKDLLGSEDPINRELGIVLALSQGMSLDKLVDKCYNEKWFMYDTNSPYNSTSLKDYMLNGYKIYGYHGYAELIIHNDNYKNLTYILKRASYIDCFKQMIKSFLKDNYPELLNKINNK